LQYPFVGNVFPVPNTVPFMRNKSVPGILSIVLFLAILIAPVASTESSEGTTPELMTRIMMFPPNAEVTGMHIDANGNFFVNAMHPDTDNYRATIGVINGIDWNDLPSSIPELASSSSESDTWNGIRTSYGDYQVLLQGGDVFSEGGVAGGIYAADDGNRMFTSVKPDYNAFVPLNTEGSRGYLYTAWEDRPSGISKLEIEWNTTSAEWKVLGGMMLDLSSVNGGWVLCFGSMSPWDTPLLSEELYFSDTEEWNDDSYNYHSDQASLADYLGYYPNPYDYGYIMEIENSTTTEPDFIKHFAMGRFSHENAQVMPDERTVYLSDDGYDTVLFKFVADTAGDLSSGTLYAAKVTQDDSSDSATTGFDVEWMEMASSSNTDIQNWIDEYDGITTADFISGQNSYITDEEIRDWAEGRLNEDLNGDGVIGSAADDRVAFLESRKAAAALGASDEWNKMEGVAFNPNAPDYLYLAMSDVGYDMSDGQGDIDVTQNRCGIVYRMTLDNGWDVNRIEPVISGGPYTSSATYECDVNNLAGPDNLLVLNDGRVLIGEDTGKHASNMVWLWGDISEPETEPEIDSDADGVVDSQDNCSDTSQGETVDAEGCSETQLPGTVEGEDEVEVEASDSDGDGYPDITDLCDNTPNDSDERVYNVEANGCANMYAPYPGECVDWEFWNSNDINTGEFGRGCPHFNQQSTQNYHDARDTADTPQKWIIISGLLVTSIIVLFMARRIREPETP
jgi:secreted PhoX family phosphatase